MSRSVWFQLLLQHQDVLCPDGSDPLRQLLTDLGPVPTLQELIGTCFSSVLTLRHLTGIHGNGVVCSQGNPGQNQDQRLREPKSL